MTEYEHPGDDGHEHDDAFVPDPVHDPGTDLPGDQAYPPLPEPGADAAHAPADLQFPGDAPADAPDAPGAAFPDDAGFGDWLGDPAAADDPGDPQADHDLRDQLAPPSDAVDGLPDSEALIERFLRGS